MENEPKVYKEPPPPQSPFKWYMANWKNPLIPPAAFFLAILVSLIVILPLAIYGCTVEIFLLFPALCAVLGFLSLLLAFITGIIQLFKKHQEIASSIFLGTFILFFFYFALFFIHINAGPHPNKDHFADNLKLPKDTELFIPVEIGVEKDDVSPQKNDLFLYEMDINVTVEGNKLYGKNGEILNMYNDSYGVAYKADIWCNPGEAGSIYLKGFEITHETFLKRSYVYYNEKKGDLDIENLKERSMIQAQYSKNPEELFCNTTKAFCIPEGEPGQFYGARFEVWFIPDSGEPERKLFEKNFKIQGCKS